MKILGVEVVVAIDGVLVGAMVARGIQKHEATSGLDEAVRRAIDAVVESPDDPESTRRVRDLLRFGRYKPTGRGKPASEYLVKAAQEGRFPRLHPLVDINNLVSLQSRLPISLVDLERAGTDRFGVRRGRAGERYVFNSANQEIDLEDLLVVTRLPEDVPTANPVKDSMATKLGDRPKDVLAVVYGPMALLEQLRTATEQFAELVRAHCPAEAVETMVYEDRTD